jgi:hypothetical protein
MEKRWKREPESDYLRLLESFARVKGEKRRKRMKQGTPIYSLGGKRGKR